MIIIAGDKHAEPTIDKIKVFLKKNDLDFKELGFQNGACPDAKLETFIPELASAIQKSKANHGILCCGTGIGVAIGANRFKSIRACLCPTPEYAEWARNKDDGNVLCLASWDQDANIDAILQTWMTTEYDGSTTRLAMFEAFDDWT